MAISQPYEWRAAFTRFSPGRASPDPALIGAAEDEAFAVGGRPAAPEADPLLRLAVCRDDPRRAGRDGLDLVLALGLAAVQYPGPAGRARRHELVPGVHRDGPLI